MLGKSMEKPLIYEIDVASYDGAVGKFLGETPEENQLIETQRGHYEVMVTPKGTENSQVTRRLVQFIDGVNEGRPKVLRLKLSMLEQ